MAPTLGKRKRQSKEIVSSIRTFSEDESESQNDSAQEVFRRHFEAHFKPLPKVKRAVNVNEEVLPEAGGEESEWGGISEPEGTIRIKRSEQRLISTDGEQVEIIEYTAPEASSTMTKDELKIFMSSKPPANTALAPTSSTLTISAMKDDPNEVTNLKKDLALQRLLAESHLLEPSSNPSSTGTNRHKVTDLRLQSLGAKTSILKQEKMPMSHRKGIISKRNEHEEKRRYEARENGIILERAKSGVRSQKEARRDRGIGGPGVGKFSGGTLKLSKKDIFDIEGPKKRSSSKGSSGRGRGRGIRRGIP